MERGKGALKRKVWIGATLVGILLSFATFSDAEMSVIGEGVSFRPGKLTPGGTLAMDIRFRVEGCGPAEVPIAFSVVEAGCTPDWSHPSIPTGMFDVSSYSVRFEHTIPPSIPSTGVCLNVYAHFTGTALRSALLISNACYGAGTRAGTGQTITLNHDLEIKINSFSIDRTRDLDPGEGVTHPANISFTIRNRGTAPFPRLPESHGWGFSLYLPTATGPYPAGWSRTAAAACDPIPAGDSVTVTKVVMIPDKTSRIKVEVNIPSYCRETNTSNNKAERGITLLVPSGRKPLRPDIRRR